MEHQGKASVTFDYTTFLGANCSKKWTFLEAMSTVAPIFGLAWKNSIQEVSTAEDRLWDQAMKSLSASRSDEANLLTLVKLAECEGIDEITLLMPYELELTQLDWLREKTHADIAPSPQDQIVIKL
ncbi:transporter [Vibrio sonorensis]|uniref:transporter n=1 Tax=Vibrio sonorensis TaxID=1004316 RepID=UPI0008DAA65A|nr:transporter [Vibrio sonorensis]